jgi:hypothetical protein
LYLERQFQELKTIGLILDAPDSDRRMGPHWEARLNQR